MSDSIIRDGFNFSLKAEGKVKKILGLEGNLNFPSTRRIGVKIVKEKLDQEFSFNQDNVERIFLLRLAYCSLLEYINLPENRSAYPDSTRIAMGKEYLDDFKSEVLKIIQVHHVTSVTPDLPSVPNHPNPSKRVFDVHLNIRRDEILRGARMILDGNDVSANERINSITYFVKLAEGQHVVQLLPRRAHPCRQMSFYVSNDSTIELTYTCH